MKIDNLLNREIYFRELDNIMQENGFCSEYEEAIERNVKKDKYIIYTEINESDHTIKIDFEIIIDNGIDETEESFILKITRIEKKRYKTWSVELEANSWDDELFNGDYEECVDYCKRHDYKIDGKEARLAQILVEDDCVIETIEIINEV